MKISFFFPKRLEVVASNPDLLKWGTEFYGKGYSAHVEFEFDGDPLEIKEQSKYAIEVNGFLFEIYYKSKGGIKSNEWLLNNIVEILNRVLRNFRNAGYVTDIHEYKPDMDECDRILKKWNVRWKRNGEAYKAVIKDDDRSLTMEELAKSLAKAKSLNVSYLSTEALDGIEEAIRNDSEPKPEQAFFTNSLEYLKEGDYRVSIIEAIIGLEIVLNNYLRNYMISRKMMAKKQIEKKFLTKNLGLTAKISGVLRLTLEESDIKMININEIIKVVELRNQIVHEGDIKKNYSDDKLKEMIKSVLLAMVLIGVRRDQLEAEPELQEISKTIAVKHKISSPFISGVKGHNISVLVSYGMSRKVKESDMKKVVVSIIEALKERDEGFVPNKHLRVEYASILGGKFCLWENGEMKFSNEKEVVGLLGPLEVERE